MIVTIINDDRRVVVDGVSRKVDPLPIPFYIHAVQWYGGWGEIEFRQMVTSAGFAKEPNERFDDIERFRPALDAWAAAAAPPPEPEVISEEPVAEAPAGEAPAA
jgi:hypothetical protein